MQMEIVLRLEQSIGNILTWIDADKLSRPSDNDLALIRDCLEQTCHSLGKGSEELRPWLELSLKRIILSRLSTDSEPLSTDSVALGYCLSCIDLAFILSQLGFLDDGSPLLILEEVFEVSQLDRLEAIFNYMESRFSLLSKPNKGKGLVLLRVCNELLRRLSKIKHTALCGRVLTLLACAYPLSERSGVNMKGDFNVDNVTNYSGKGSVTLDQQFFEKLSTSQESASFDLRHLELNKSDYYMAFWRLQDFFSNTPAYLNTVGFDELKRCMEVSQDIIREINQSETELSKGQKQSIATADPLEFFPKYLTNDKLFLIQLRNLSFRQTILVQMIIVLYYLKDQLGKMIKEKEVLKSKDESSVPKDSTTAPVKEKSEEKSVFPENDDRIWVLKRISNTWRLLEGTANSSSLIRSLRNIIDRENNWVSWKAQSCPNPEKPPVTIEEPEPIKPKPFVAKTLMGNRELARLWRSYENSPEADRNLKIPDLMEFLEPLKEQLDPDSMVEEEYRLSKNETFVWRALRIASKKHSHLFRNMESFDVEELLKTLISANGSSENAMETDDNLGQTLDQDVTNGNSTERASSPNRPSSSADVIENYQEPIFGNSTPNETEDARASAEDVAMALDDANDHSANISEHAYEQETIDQIENSEEHEEYRGYEEEEYQLDRTETNLD